MLNINIDSDLEPLRMSVQEMQELEHTIQDYTTQVQTILQQLQQLTIQLQGQAEPNIVPLETEYIQLQQQHDALSLKIGAQTQQLENSQKRSRSYKKLPATAKKQKHNTNKRAAYINYCQVVTPKRFHCSNLYSELCWTIY